LLADGEVESDTVYALAKEEKIARRTLERAKTDIGAKSINMGDVWVWTME